METGLRYRAPEDESERAALELLLRLALHAPTMGDWMARIGAAQFRALVDRIVDVAGALRARGYAPQLAGELHLELRDEELPENSGRWLLRVENGQGEVARGGAGRISLHVRDLAALYSGYLTPSELQAVGSIHGPAADLALAGLLFAGPAPWISNIF